MFVHIAQEVLDIAQEVLDIAQEVLDIAQEVSHIAQEIPVNKSRLPCQQVSFDFFCNGGHGKRENTKQHKLDKTPGKIKQETAKSVNKDSCNRTAAS